jgi:valyl-tRNA synthetase
MEKSVQGGDVKILVERFEKTYFNWIHNLRDWCISRQIWFGHRIPVWYCLSCGKEKIEPAIKSKWFIVRHGQTEYNRDDRYQGGESDSPLTEEGRRQAEEIAERLKDQNIELILTSDLGRAKETAAIIAKAIGAEVISDPAMNERHFGELGGMTTAEVHETYGETRVYEKKIADVETYQNLEARVWKAFKEHKLNHHRKNVVIVSHGSATRMLMKQIRNLEPEEAMSAPHMKNGEMISIDVAKDVCASCGNDLYEQDPDVLDTWFSSALWTFSTLGWPEKTPDLKRFHPTAVLETGYDILFFWVARMILMSGFHLGQVPFKTVYLHGLVRDEKGQKISKSLGNNIDPVDMGAKYGTDAVRVSLIVGMAPGTDSKISESKIRGYKNFANKIWNISRYVLENREGADLADHTQKNAEWSAEDKKDLADLDEAVRDTTKLLEEYRIDLAFDRVYHYVWHTFADVVIEKSKTPLKNGTPEERERTSAKMFILLTASLKLLHPFMPFVTEEIWSHLPKKESDLLMIADWPNGKN